eukprot:TRINITY_DN1846_c1_g2_i1.p1 TRINITY_DN1846_c1_g2~~TRINITY_DN1846_c1_g2_i1.p1  ORF type:complete len:307 (-),score=70.49 TRINITY_DN1846_c1_g2_i1:211-1092(-)
MGDPYESPEEGADEQEQILQLKAALGMLDEIAPDTPDAAAVIAVSDDDEKDTMITSADPRVDARQGGGQQQRRRRRSARYWEYTAGDEASLRRAAQDSDPRACFRCGARDHFISDCPMAAAEQRSRSPQPPTCYRCGEVGHIARNCTAQAPSPSPYRSRSPPYNDQRPFARTDSADSFRRHSRPSSRSRSPSRSSHSDNSRSSRSSRSSSSSRSRSPERPRYAHRASSGEPSCYNCGRTGHLGPNCPAPGIDQLQRRFSPKPPPPRRDGYHIDPLRASVWSVSQGAHRRFSGP